MPPPARLLYRVHLVHFHISARWSEPYKFTLVDYSDEVLDQRGLNISGFQPSNCALPLQIGNRYAQFVAQIPPDCFASGFTASRGSKLQLSYNIAKNFQFLTSYFLTESNASNPGLPL